MIKIPRMSDRYKFKIGEDFEFVVAPLSRLHKLEIQSCSKMVNGETMPDLTEMQYLYLKYGLKDIKGIKYCDGEDFKLQFENGALSDECLDELVNIPQKPKMLEAMWQVLNGAPDELISIETGKKLEGIEFDIVSGKQ